MRLYLSLNSVTAT